MRAVREQLPLCPRPRPHQPTPPLLTVVAWLRRRPYWYNLLGYAEDGTASLFKHADRVYLLMQCETIIKVVRAGPPGPRQQGTTWERALADPGSFWRMKVPEGVNPLCVETHADRGVHAANLHMVMPTAQCVEAASPYIPGHGRLAARGPSPHRGGT